jgi:ABC-type phosphate transport system substrate-binding protein
MRTRTLLLALAATVAVAAAPAVAEDFKVVVNGANGTSSLSRQQLSQLFLKKTTQWPNGQSVSPVEPRDDRLHALFCKQVHGKSANAVKAYWNQVIFSGRDVPPVEKSGDEEVVQYVRATPGAVGYVSGDAATGGVKVVQVKD